MWPAATSQATGDDTDADPTPTGADGGDPAPGTASATEIDPRA
jgi:hypothetical protein